MSAERAAIESLLTWLNRYAEALNEALKKGGEASLDQRLHPDLPTVGEIMAHVMVTEDLYVRYVLGEQNLPPEAPREMWSTWELQAAPVVIGEHTLLDAQGRSASAEVLIAAHRQSHHNIVGRLAGATDANLGSFYDGPYNRGDILAGVLAVLIAHEAYHVCEVRTLVTMLGKAG